MQCKIKLFHTIKATLFLINFYAGLIFLQIRYEYCGCSIGILFSIELGVRDSFILTMFLSKKEASVKMSFLWFFYDESWAVAHILVQNWILIRFKFSARSIYLTSIFHYWASAEKLFCNPYLTHYSVFNVDQSYLMKEFKKRKAWEGWVLATSQCPNSHKITSWKKKWYIITWAWL